MLTWCKSLTATLLACVILLGSLPGCAGLLRRRSDRSETRRDLPAPQTNRRPGDPVSTEILAAVEAFLDRTAEYQSTVAQRPDITAAAAPTLPSKAGKPSARQPAARADSPPGETDQTAQAPVIANARVTLRDPAPLRPKLALPVIQFVSVRDPSATAPSAVAEAPQAKTANEPLSANEPDEAFSPDRLVAYLESETSGGDDFDAEWRLRVTQLALQRDQDALNLSPTLPESSRKLLTALFRTATAVRQAARDPLSDAAGTLERVENLRAVVTDRADPVVSAVALCRKVVTFGVYEEMNASAFTAGRPIQTIVYSEIKGFRSEPTDDGRFRTRLSTRLEVLTSDGRSMWQHEEPEITDLCRRRRTDFFIAQRITLPPNLPAGDYVLKVWIEDKVSGRADEATHGFVIGSSVTVRDG